MQSGLNQDFLVFKYMLGHQVPQSPTGQGHEDFDFRFPHSLACDAVRIPGAREGSLFPMHLPGSQEQLAFLLCKLSYRKKVGHGVLSTEGIFGSLCVLKFGTQEKRHFLDIVLLLPESLSDIFQNVK